MSEQTITINTKQMAAVLKLLSAAKEAKKFLIPDLYEPGRTVFWNLVDAIADYEKGGIAAEQTAWQPLATAPDDRPHIRGLWVYTPEGEVSHFECFAGSVDGYYFRDEYDNDTGWPAADFDYWCELPPAP